MCDVVAWESRERESLFILASTDEYVRRGRQVRPICGRVVDTSYESATVESTSVASI